MNRKILEKALAHIFTENLDWLESDSWYAADGEYGFTSKVVEFNKVCETFEHIEEEILNMLCEGED